MSRKNNPAPAPTISIQVAQATNSFLGGVVHGPVHVGSGGPFSSSPGAPSPDPSAHVPAAPPPAFPAPPPPAAAAGPRGPTTAPRAPPIVGLHTSRKTSNPGPQGSSGAQPPSQIAWLHLTDLHVGQADKDHAWPTMRERFFDDLAHLHDVSGPWDMVLFTGDLTQRGSPEEFARLDRTLDKLWDRFARLGSSPALLAVPGNHDLVRPGRSTAAFTALGQWQDKDAVRFDFWERPNTATRKLVNKAFEPYVQWWQSRRPAAPPIREGLLPGDFAATFEAGALRLGIVGLNSAFLQLAGGDFEGKLDLDANQLHALKAPGDDDAVDWLRSHHLNLLLTHHPMGWLHPASLVRAREHLCPAGRFAVHLHGHMHEPDLLSQRRLGASVQRFFQGASLFGKEEWGDAGKGQARIHGYAAARLTADVPHLRAELRVWPRLLLRKPGGHSRVEPDRFHYDLDADSSLVEPIDLRPIDLPPAPRTSAGSPHVGTTPPAPTPDTAPETAAPGSARTIRVPFETQGDVAPASGEHSRPVAGAGAPGDSPRTAAPVRVYVSFADEDARFAGELEKHLAPHLRDGTLTLWHRGLLRPGDLREPTTFRELAAARVIVLLLSANHAAALSGEVERAVERQGRGAATLVPVRLRAAAPLPALAPFQSLPPNGPPLASRRSRDSAWTEVVKGILDVSARFEPA